MKIVTWLENIYTNSSRKSYSDDGDALDQWLCTGAPQEFSKHALPDYAVRGTDRFSLGLSHKKMTTANTAIAIQCEWIKIIPIFLSDWENITYSLVSCRILVFSSYVPWAEKVWKSLHQSNDRAPGSAVQGAADWKQIGTIHWGMPWAGFVVFWSDLIKARQSPPGHSSWCIRAGNLPHPFETVLSRKIF